jgi:hypothetical protein
VKIRRVFLTVSLYRRPGIFACGFYVGAFHERFLRAASSRISLSSTRPRRLQVPWLTYKCRDAISALRIALRDFQAHPKQENLVVFKLLHSGAQDIILEAKRTSWQHFVASLSRSTSSGAVWNKLRCMSRKSNRTSIFGHLCWWLIPYSARRHANAIASPFLASPINYDTRFIAIKDSAETTHLNFSSRVAEVYNSPFSMVEFIA